VTKYQTKWLTATLNTKQELCLCGKTPFKKESVYNHEQLI